jgi:hypothetical protein
MCPKPGICGEIRLFVAKFGLFCGEKSRTGRFVLAFFLILGAKTIRF